MTRDIRDEHGQSTVELALLLPLLLLLLLGLADFGRSFYYTSAIANAAGVGAEYASMNATALSSDPSAAAKVTQKACNATGFADYGSSCPGLSVSFTPSPLISGADTTVTVQYDFQLLSTYLVSRIVSANPVTLRATSTFPGLN